MNGPTETERLPSGASKMGSDPSAMPIGRTSSEARHGSDTGGSGEMAAAASALRASTVVP